MKFGSNLDGTCDQIQPFWPLVLSHKIDKSSPLWELSPKDIQSRQFEIILTLEGCTPETGTTVQARTSYLPSEILWGQQFEHSTVEYDKDMAKYAVQLTSLNKIVPDRTPRYSRDGLDCILIAQMFAGIVQGNWRNEKVEDPAPFLCLLAAAACWQSHQIEDTILLLKF